MGVKCLWRGGKWVLVWLNVECVLHLQVADSIPAQVSGLAVVVVHVHVLRLFPSLLSRFCGNIGMDTTNLPLSTLSFPHLPPLFIFNACFISNF